MEKRFKYGSCCADRVVAESLENSRTNRCVNLMGLFLFLMFLLPYEFKFKMNVCF